MERYAAAQPDATSGAVIKSRHILHPDNAVAVTALVEDLHRSEGAVSLYAGTVSPTRGGSWRTLRPS